MNDRAQLNPKWIINLKGKDFPLYAGVLDLAHQLGLQSIETQLIQIPGETNDYTAIAKATVRMKDGSVFEEFGDANPRNVTPMIAPAIIRMALTRAKGRALRDAVNIGQTILEELPDLDDADAHEATSRAMVAAPTVAYRPEPHHRSVVAEAPSPMPAGRAEGNGDGKVVCSNPACGKPLTKGQHEVSVRAYGQPLCPACQKIHAKLG
jgi:hypothetical protein